MSTLTQQDFDVRLQLINCCIGNKAGTLIDKIKIGAKDVNCKLQDLEVSIKMLEYLKCYKLDIPEVQSVGSFQITTLTVGFTLEIFIDGVSITGIQTASITNRNTTMHALVNIINSYQSTYTAVINETGDLHSVDLYGPCEGGTLTYETDGTSGEIELSLTDLEGGECAIEYNNCLTEDQIIAMIDWMSNKCNLCFQPPGFLYE
jgi:hypothetical protein